MSTPGLHLCQQLMQEASGVANHTIRNVHGPDNYPLWLYSSLEPRCDKTWDYVDGNPGKPAVE